MSGGIGLSRIYKSDDEILRDALGVVSWNYNPQNIATQTTTSTQLIYAVGIGLRSGQVVTNILLDVEVAGTSTAPTGFYVGLASSTAMIEQSANLAASSALTTQAIGSFALAAPTTITADGIYYVMILMNGAFAGTAHQLGRGSGRNKIGSVWMAATAGSGQTTLPANAAAISLVTTNSLNYWVGVS